MKLADMARNEYRAAKDLRFARMEQLSEEGFERIANGVMVFSRNGHRSLRDRIVDNDKEVAEKAARLLVGRLRDEGFTVGDVVYEEIDYSQHSYVFTVSW